MQKGLALLLATVALLAQNDVLRVNTRLVEVDVVVHGKDGPVMDLAKDDFTLLDNGVPQRIDVFSVSAGERSRPQPEQAPLKEGVVANRRGRTPPASATVILFDRLNTADIYQRQGKVQLLSYMKSARREDFTALYVLGDDLQLIQDFTGNTDQLVRAVENMPVGDLPGVDNRTVQEIAQSQAVGRVTRRDVRVAVAEADFSVVQRTDPTEDAIQTMARHLNAFPGRKSLIWMSAAGIPLSIQPGSSRNGKESELDHATRTFTAANIAVYPIDLRGLQAPDPPRGRRGSRQDPPPDVMIRLADQTGGRAFYYNNDLAGSVRTAISDAATRYTLGFYPSENAFDGKFHNLDVKVARKDVEVRHRTGYFAVKDQAPSEKERKLIMSEVISSPLDSLQIGLEASSQRISPNGGAFRIVLHIDASDLKLEHRGDRWIGIADIATRLESSKQKNIQGKTSSIDLSEEGFRAALARGLTLEETVTTDRPPDRVRVVVLDRATGFAGSLWVPLKP